GRADLPMAGQPSRRLPTGVTLAALAGDDLGEFTEHVDGTAGRLRRHCRAARATDRPVPGGSARWAGSPTLVGHTDLAGTGPYLRSDLGRPRSLALGT